MSKKPHCPEGHAPPHFWADLEGEEIMVVIGLDGHPTGYWADGTRGLTPETRRAAEECDDVYCPICLNEVDWK